MLNLPASVRILVARGATTDLRHSFDRLSAMVSEVLQQAPFWGHVFVFFNQRPDRVKLLVWERGGFWLLYKRLEVGTFAVLDCEEITEHASCFWCSKVSKWCGSGCDTSEKVRLRCEIPCATWTFVTLWCVGDKVVVVEWKKETEDVVTLEETRKFIVSLGEELDRLGRECVPPQSLTLPSSG